MMKPITAAIASRAKTRPFTPPRKSTPNAMVVMTTKAPKSGSRSSRKPTNRITVIIGRKPRLKLLIASSLRTV